MKTSWIEGLEPDVEKEIRGDFKSSRLVRRRLTTLLEKKINERINVSLDKNEYDVSNWAYKQADAIGYIRALKEIQSLLEE